MFGLSFGELLIIAVLALLLLGPDRLPEAAKTFGKGLRDLRRVTEDLKDQVESEIYADERRPAKPELVPPVASSPVPGEPPPPATFDNVPGLEAAVAEPSGAADGAATPPAPPAAASGPVAPAAAEPVAPGAAEPAPDTERPGTT